MKHKNEIPRRVTFATQNPKSPPTNPRRFDYSLDFKQTNFRETPELYRIGVGEQGVLLVEPYKSEILPLWRFRTPDVARESSKKIYAQFLKYRRAKDIVGMDMARKFLQMGYTRSRRYANHSSGQKYDRQHKVLPRSPDEVKAQSAEVFRKVWKRVEKDSVYAKMKAEFKAQYG